MPGSAGRDYDRDQPLPKALLYDDNSSQPILRPFLVISLFLSQCEPASPASRLSSFCCKLASPTRSGPSALLPRPRLGVLCFGLVHCPSSLDKICTACSRSPWIVSWCCFQRYHLAGRLFRRLYYVVAFRCILERTKTGTCCGSNYRSWFELAEISFAHCGPKESYQA